MYKRQVHYGYNNVPAEFKKASDAIGGDTFEDRSKIQYIDELDENDNVNVRLNELEKYYDTNLVKPEVEWRADGTVLLTICLLYTSSPLAKARSEGRNRH